MGRRGIEDSPEEPTVSTKGVRRASSHKAEDYPRKWPPRMPLWTPDEADGWILVVYASGTAFYLRDEVGEGKD